ncbi:MAG: choice-of-anchor X domain-containing protein, partial [Thermoplasmatota archaeon]
MKKRAIVIILLLAISVLNLGISIGNASNIDTIDISPSQNIDGKMVARGNVTISVIDEGDSDNCELWIDDSLYSYMDNVTGTYDWSYELNTEGFDDGAHTIQVRSIGGTGGTDIKAKQVWFDNEAPITNNKTINYPVGYDAAKDNSSVHIKAEITDDISGVGSVSVNATQFGEGIVPMYDDGDHQDEAANDGIYCTPSFMVYGETSYKYINITIKDKIGNVINESVELKLDNTKPTIRGLQKDLPSGQSAVKEG